MKPNFMNVDENEGYSADPGPNQAAPSHPAPSEAGTCPSADELAELLAKAVECMKAAKRDIGEHLQVAKFNLRGEMHTGDKLPVPDAESRMLIHENGITDSEVVRALLDEGIKTIAPKLAAWNRRPAAQPTPKGTVEGLRSALEAALWSEQHGEAEAHKQGRPRLMQRLELYRSALTALARLESEEE
jgi:hypothetical protein